MNTREWIDLEKNVLLHTYARPDFVISQGRENVLYDLEGRAYLDFVSGIAVCALGHVDEECVDALTQQAEKLWHCSNLYHTESQVKLAQLLVESTFADKVFFCNSGTEAVEAAIKFARKWGRAERGGAFQILSLKRSFHGRTYGALSATGQPNLQQGFEPMLPGFVFADFNDLLSVEKALSPSTCAILVEPVQGEGGIYPASVEFLQGIRRLCDRENVLLILDEIQCGFGRTGYFCAHEFYDIYPDMMTCAKPIAGGLPLGAVLLRDAVAACVEPGDHGSTFGGGPLVTAVAHRVLSRLKDQQFLSEVRNKGNYLMSQLNILQQVQSHIVEVRGQGLMIAIQLAVDPKQVIQHCAAEGLLICKAGGQAIRFLPSLTVTLPQIDNAVNILSRVLSRIGENGDTSS